MSMESALDEFGRFSAPALQILISVAAEPKHGWSIAADIEQRTGRRPQPATLYGALSRLEDGGWIVAMEQEGRRRPFAITSAGRRMLGNRLDELDQLVRAGRLALGWVRG